MKLPTSIEELQEFEREQAALRETLWHDAVDAGDYGKALVYLGSEEVAEGIVRLMPLVTDDELRKILLDEWTRCDTHGHVREEMLEAFHRTGYMSDADRTFTGPQTIYRGNLGEDPTLGISWTLSKEHGEFFARYCTGMRAAWLGIRRADGLDPDPAVWQATVEGEDILAHFNDRGEEEVVIDPVTVKDVRRIS